MAEKSLQYENLREQIDSWVMQYREKPFAGTFYGIPFEDFTHEELLAVIAQLEERQRAQKTSPRY